MTDIRLVGGNAEDVAEALIAGKPVSDDLSNLYGRVLREHLADLVAKHLPAPELHDSNK